tara:strand:- start:3953 stop:4345 length:393 start_codon:yes stop_codon:yes gene_type:complete
MFQPYKEKNLILQIGQKVEVDNTSFYIKKFSIHWDVDDFLITAWGSRPHATTFHWSRVIKYEDFIWRPEKDGLTFFTLDGQSFDRLSFDEEQYMALIKSINEGTEEITSCWVNITTAINEPMYYDFDKEH